MLEKSIASFLVKSAKEHGVFIRKCRWEGRIGCPDYLMIKNGVVRFAETKSPGEKPRLSQLTEFNLIKKAGSWVYIVDSQKSAEEAVEHLCELSK